ncbi:MAG: aminotransferase class V-fold PLP-dependent enzyme [Bacteroidia bacterium]|nr:aminotransferase class V-fold PLP-dependent enzyme [Bacteroidia bacterium]
MTEAQLRQCRADTPGTQDRIHLNNAGSSLPPESVLRTVTDYLEAEARTGGYELMAARQAETAQTYASIAALIGAQPDEIAFVKSASDAWYQAFYALNLQPGDIVLTTQTEYIANYFGLLRAVKHQGIEIQLVPLDADGLISLPDLERMAAAPRVRLIALTHVPTSSGLIQPAAAVGALARQAGVPYLLDACQSVGQLALDAAALGCDLLAATGRKFLRGPRGTGFLYVRSGFLDQVEPPFPDGWSAEWDGLAGYAWRSGARRFEQFEYSRALQLGLGAAADYALGLGMAQIEARVLALAARLRAQLGSLPEIRLQDPGRERCGIVTLTHARVSAPELMARLGSRSIQTSVASHMNARLDLETRSLDSVLRVSVHYYNTEAELDRLCEALEDL